MKCLRCDRQNDYRTRKAAGRACAGCGHKFAFETREGDPLTDRAFAAAIAGVSEDGRLAWVDRQLYYEVARRVRRRRPIHRLRRRARVSIEYSTFGGLLVRWRAVYGEPAGRLEPGAFATDLRAAERAPDATAYGFDRLLVCGSDEIVDVLLANSFHADHRCAVVSVTGYPYWAYELLFPAFRASPPKLILVAHDADVPGCRLAKEVRSGPGWFGGVDGVAVLDAGLRPGDAPRFRGLYLKGSPVDVLREPVSVAEGTWLTKYRVELAAPRPRALMAILSATLNRTDDDRSGAPSADGVWPSVAVWGVDGDGGPDDDVG